MIFYFLLENTSTKEESASGQQKLSTATTNSTTTSTTTTTASKERKSSGKKTRWGSDEDRVPYEQIMLMQSVSLGMQFPNAALDLAVQDQRPQIENPVSMDFYSEISENDSASKLNSKEDFTKDVEEDEIRAQVHNFFFCLFSLIFCWVLFINWK